MCVKDKVQIYHVLPAGWTQAYLKIHQIISGLRIRIHQLYGISAADQEFQEIYYNDGSLDASYIVEIVYCILYIYDCSLVDDTIGDGQVNIVDIVLCLISP